MTSNPLYLKQNIVLEPLINCWHAWSYLLAPATAAMYLTNSHLKIMQSFVSAPKVHMSALKSRKLMAGPFINYDESRVDEVKALIEAIIKEQAYMMALADAIKHLNQTLISDAKGYALDELYSKVPVPLQGFVELTYNLNNQPSMRFLEGLLYRSHYKNHQAQSLAMYPVKQDRRPFIFSTPRLPQSDNIHVNIPFNHLVIDKLAKMKYAPNDVAEIKEILAIEPRQEPLFSSFFTPSPPPQRPEPYQGDDIRVRYFGHACLLIQSADVSVLCDPLISYSYDAATERYTYADLPLVIDYVVITHHHHDHCVIETLLQLRHRVKTVIVPKNNSGNLADPSMKLVLQTIGFKDVREVDVMDDILIPGGHITGLPFLGEHGDLEIHSKMAYLVTIFGKSIMVSADSKACDSHIYKHVRESITSIHALFIGLQCDGAPLSWAYGALLPKSLGHKMDTSRQVDGANFEIANGMVEQLKPESVYVYAMGYEPWLSYMMMPDESGPNQEVRQLVAACQETGTTANVLSGRQELYFARAQT